MAQRTLALIVSAATRAEGKTGEAPQAWPTKPQAGWPPGWWLEDQWQDKTIRVSDVEIDVARPAVRCTMITRPQPGLDRDLGIFRAVARAHGGTLAMWATVRTPGAIRVSDRVELAGPTTQPPNGGSPVVPCRGHRRPSEEGTSRGSRQR